MRSTSELDSSCETSPASRKVSANKTEEKEKEGRKNKQTEDEEEEEEDDENKPHGVYVRICPERGTREVKDRQDERLTKSRWLSTY